MPENNKFISVNLDRLSKFISLVLRHKPEAAGISLDEHGWADVTNLLEGICRTGRKIDFATLAKIVETDEKGRYSFNSDRSLIRANQGHSIAVDVELTEMEPPEHLYHGTAERNLAKIEEEGLKPMGRLYVHLSKDAKTAAKVGKRHGNPVILMINTGQMYRDGMKFFISANGVWLTKYVEPGYLSVMAV